MLLYTRHRMEEIDWQGLQPIRKQYPMHCWKSTNLDWNNVAKRWDRGRLWSVWLVLPAKRCFPFFGNCLSWNTGSKIRIWMLKKYFQQTRAVKVMVWRAFLSVSQQAALRCVCLWVCLCTLVFHPKSFTYLLIFACPAGLSLSMQTASKLNTNSFNKAQIWTHRLKIRGSNYIRGWIETKRWF